MIRIFSVILTFILAAAGSAHCGMFARVGQGKLKQPAKVILSTGRSLDKAMVSFRPDLKILVFVAKKKKHFGIEFKQIACFEQVVLDEGMEREWRWKEGGADEKIYTGRAYPWRKYGVKITLNNGKVIKGKITSGFPLRITWSQKSDNMVSENNKQQQLLDEMNRNVGNTMSAVQRDFLREKIRKMQENAKLKNTISCSKTFIINAKNKGKMGEKLKDLVYIKNLDFRKMVADDLKANELEK